MQPTNGPDADEQPLLLPVGLHIGALYTEPGRVDHVQQIRRGTEVVELDDVSFAVWALAHGTVDGAAATTVTRESVLERVRRDGPGVVAGAVLDDLLDRGLLVEVSPGKSALAFARTHNLLPRMLGLGNSRDEPWLYDIGLSGAPVIQVSNAVYDLWKFSHLEATLWVGCRGAAEIAQRVGVTDPQQTDPQQLLDAFLQMCHGLLSVSAACFDPVRPVPGTVPGPGTDEGGDR